MKNIAIKYGLLMFAGFLIFFLTMRGIGLKEVYELRGFNGIIHLGLIFLAIREYRRRREASAGNYLSGVALGMFTSVIGVFLFTIFMGFYLGYDTTFMQNIKQDFPIGKYLTPFTTTLFITTEGIAIGLIGSYILTRLVDFNVTPGGHPENADSTA